MKIKPRRGWHWSYGLFRMGILRRRAFKMLPTIQLGELHGKRICGQLSGEVFWSFLFWYGWFAW